MCVRVLLKKAYKRFISFNSTSYRLKNILIVSFIRYNRTVRLTLHLPCKCQILMDGLQTRHLYLVFPTSQVFVFVVTLPIKAAIYTVTLFDVLRDLSYLSIGYCSSDSKFQSGPRLWNDATGRTVPCSQCFRAEVDNTGERIDSKTIKHNIGGRVLDRCVQLVGRCNLCDGRIHRCITGHRHSHKRVGAARTQRKYGTAREETSLFL